MSPKKPSSDQSRLDRSPLDRATAERVSLDLVRLVKLVKVVRMRAPRIHPAIDTMAYPLLFNLAQEELRVSALAERIHSDISTTSRQVTTLVGHGLLEKVSDPEDGRAQVVRLSPDGLALLEQVKAQRLAWFRELLADWTPEEASRFADDLERFTATLEAQAPTILDPTSSATTSPTASSPTTTEN
ncbi:MarR family transcriptional regulator [Knoellia koreensis]|uniref:MarR family transcriptional regulator n=1 Tax=Knoellia koreensis TaxID=2730921 RepID=A0A849HJ94_9MICO|nr:MarR family transcriptional regulator [Knoellia sp. DB2414S]